MKIVAIVFGGVAAALLYAANWCRVAAIVAQRTSPLVDRENDPLMGLYLLGGIAAVLAACWTLLVVYRSWTGKCP